MPVDPVIAANIEAQLALDKHNTGGAALLPLLPGAIHNFAAAVEPHTEADPMAVLLQGLAAFGAIMGPGPTTTLEDHQPPLISPVIVGRTAKARKGTSWGLVKRLLTAIEPGFADRTMHGFGSGEALIDAVRDPGDDEPTIDRRLLVVEQEYARHLKVCQRESSILSAVIRNAYDGARLENRTRGGGVIVATNPHVAFVGHVVQDELRRYLTSSEIAGGFANRHLFLTVKSSKTLPRGVRVTDELIEEHAHSVRRAITFARNCGDVEWTPAADDLWNDEIRPLMAADDVPGMLGALVARPEGNTARLALLFALSDLSPVVDRDHLAAAWTIWQRCRQSVEQLFGDMSGNPQLDLLLEALRHAPDGLDGRGVDRVLSGRNVKEVVAEGIHLNLIVEANEPTGGRPRTIFRIAEEAEEAEEVPEW